MRQTTERSRFGYEKVNYVAAFRETEFEYHVTESRRATFQEMLDQPMVLQNGLSADGTTTTGGEPLQ